MQRTWHHILCDALAKKDIFVKKTCGISFGFIHQEYYSSTIYRLYRLCYTLNIQ
jgi:hypothetical protein